MSEADAAAEAEAASRPTIAQRLVSNRREFLPRASKKRIFGVQMKSPFHLFQFFVFEPVQRLSHVGIMAGKLF